MEGDRICIISSDRHHCPFIPIKLDLPSPSYCDLLFSFPTFFLSLVLIFTRFVIRMVTKKISMKKNYSPPLPLRKRQRKNDWNASRPVTNIPPPPPLRFLLFLLFVFFFLDVHYDLFLPLHFPPVFFLLTQQCESYFSII